MGDNLISLGEVGEIKINWHNTRKVDKFSRSRGKGEKFGISWEKLISGT